MSREGFLKSIQVDQEVIDRINQVSLENNQTASDGQWTKGSQEQELAQTTGFDRDGDDTSPKDSTDIKKDMDSELDEVLALNEELDELPELDQKLDEMPELQEELDEMPELQEDLDELPELDESLDEQPGGEETDTGMDNDMDTGMDGGMAM